MALTSSAILILTNTTASPITLTDLRDTPFDPPASGHPTVPASPGSIQVLLTPAALRSQERGEIYAFVNAGSLDAKLRLGQENSGFDVEVHNGLRQGTQGVNSVLLAENEITTSDNPLVLTGEPISIGSTDVLNLTANGRILFRDTPLANSTWTPFATVDLALVGTEWNTFIANFGEVSLVNAINASAVQSLDSAYNNGIAITVDAGPIALSGAAGDALHLLDSNNLAFGDASDITIGWDITGGVGSEVWLFDRTGAVNSTTVFRFGVATSGQSWQIQDSTTATLFQVGGDGQATFSGNVNAALGLDVTGAGFTHASGGTGNVDVSWDFSGNIVVSGGSLLIQDGFQIALGTDSDHTLYHDSASRNLVVAAIQSTGQSAGTGDSGPGLSATLGTGTDASAGINTGGSGGLAAITCGAGGLAVEALAGDHRDAGAGGGSSIRGGFGGAARGSTDVTRSAGNGGAGGSVLGEGGQGGAAQEASGTGADHGAAGSGGAVSFQGGQGGAGSVSEVGGAGGAVLITGGSGGITGGAGAGTDGSLSIGTADTSTIAIGVAGNTLAINAPTTHALGVEVQVGGLRLNEGAAPTAVVNAGFIYTKDVTGVTELFYREDSGAGGTEIQLTNNGAGAGGAVPEQLQHIANSFTVANTDGTVAIAQFAYDASTFTTEYATFSFRAVTSVTTGRTGTITLYNLTDAEAVTITSFGALTETTPTKHEGTVTVGAAAGNLKNTEKIYEIRVSVDGSTAAHTMTVGSSVLRLEV